MDCIASLCGVSVSVCVAPEGQSGPESPRLNFEHLNQTSSDFSSRFPELTHVCVGFLLEDDIHMKELVGICILISFFIFPDSYTSFIASGKWHQIFHI